ncbi:unnamed protein product [Polarella glacialis]|uniref:Uncharacterized protein n=1 Tax=Polarella glacialis TaxID=89957 RepID=A0A813DCX5_POLGL|nr:unnamed protein product [Polarella glacialis]
MTMTNKSGDRGHPWQIPNVWPRTDACIPDLKYPVCVDGLDDLQHLVRQATHLRAFRSASGEMLSKAFAQSSANNITLSSFVSHTFSNNLLVRNNASRVPQPDLNPNWVGHIRCSAPASCKRRRRMTANSL